MIEITERTSLSDEELEFTASHSGGPGGQNVNKTSTRVTLWFDVVRSPSLSQEQKSLVLRRLKNRVGADGLLRVISQQTRSQAANRELAVERFVELMREALRQTPARKTTRVSSGARERRLEAKREHSKLKKERSRRIPEDI
ncbi:MAG: alternative ribosome rescue aminoacyl-tRNA hydrolase ArfB [Syntrophobacteraceae bacterium]